MFQKLGKSVKPTDEWGPSDLELRDEWLEEQKKLLKKPPSEEANVSNIELNNVTITVPNGETKKKEYL